MLRKLLALSVLSITMFSGMNANIDEAPEALKSIINSVEDTECKKSLNEFFGALWAAPGWFAKDTSYAFRDTDNMIKAAKQRTLSTSQAELTERFLGLKVVFIENSFVKNSGIVSPLFPMCQKYRLQLKKARIEGEKTTNLHLFLNNSI